MAFDKTQNALVYCKNGEKLQIESWGENSLRVRSTLDGSFSGNDWALSEQCEKANCKINITDDEATITNGKIKAVVSANGILSFYKVSEKSEKLLLSEYHRCYDGRASKESVCLKVVNREFKGVIGGAYSLTVRFNATDGEKIFGMGQYQMPYLDLKGCSLELAQRNSQVSIPFAVSSLGYGFLWNNPAVGSVQFAKNITEWKARCCDEMDYWITADDTPKDILKNYTAVTGRAPVMPKDLLGFWQCKLRYRTQDEVLTVARKYKELGIHLDVIVIDFFHWVRQGEWGFDSDYWPDPKAMCDELHAMGTKVMVSVWPSVDMKSSHYAPMAEAGLLVRTERGTPQTYNWNGDCSTFDATNPKAREFIYNVCRESYLKYGIDMFWLDNAEPDLTVYDFDNYRYSLGSALKVSNLYPKCYAQAFYDGMKADGKKDIVNLLRCGWAGSQKYGTVLWNGDIQSSFECLRDSVAEGINMGLSGIAWWNTDIGGFMWGNIHDEKFIHLLTRWFEFAVYTPIMRLHGDRDPHDIPPLSTNDFGGGYLFTGANNEIWSYGKEAQKIFEKQIALRERLRDYTASVMKEASENGSPVLRAMFYEFPEDEKCWDLSDQYMFGSKYLVAPILTADTYSREVYLPAGKWKDERTGEIIDGGKTITAQAPIDSIPVFSRAQANA